MKLISVDLRNFRSHINTKLDFSDGVIAIIGENGAGKSSILEAINYALFPMSYRNQEELMRKGSREMIVSLVIEIDGKQYRITRARREGKPESKLEVRQGDMWRMIQHGSQDVNKSLEELGLRSDIFENTIYIRQGEIASLLNAKPAERKKIVGRILGTEDLEEIYEELRDIISEIKQRESGLEGEVKRIGNLKEELGRIKDDLAKKNEEKSELERKEKEISMKIDEIKRRIEEEEKKRDLHNKLSAQLEEIRRGKEERERRREDINRDIMLKNEELRRILGQEEIEKLEKKARIYEQYLNYWRLIGEIQYINNEITRLEREIEEIETAKKMIPELEEEKSKIEREVYFLEKEMKELERIEGGLKAEKDIINKAEDEINFSRRRIDEILKLAGAKDIPALKNILLDMQSRADDLRNLISSLEAEVKSRNREVSGLKEIIEILEKGERRCPVCSAELSDERRMEIISEKRKEVDELILKIKEIEKEIASKKEEFERKRREAEDMADLEKKASLLNQKIEEKQKEIEIRREKVRTLNEKLSRKEEKEKKLVDLRGKINELNRRIGELSRYGKTVEELSKEIKGRKEELDEYKMKLETLNKEAERIAEEIKKAGMSVERGLEHELEDARKRWEEADKLIRELDDLRRRLNEVNSEIDQLERRISELRREIDEVGFKEEIYEELKKGIDSLSKEREGIIGRISQIEGEIRTKEERVRSLEAEISDLEGKEKTLNKIKRFLEAIHEVRNAFSKDGIQRILRERGKAAIEYYSNKIFRDFGLPYEKLELTEDYGISLIRGNQRFSMENLSGGEKIVAAISLRLGIALAKAGRMDFLIMDEPTVHLDDIRRENLIEIVDRLPQLGGRMQLIVVTHLKDFEAVADQIVRVRRDRSGISIAEVAQ
ncbi:MAG: AAA family ATPase [Candidatus Methanodesulfokora sp.]